MSQTPNYTKYHPRWYRKPVSTYWWSHKWAYLIFILRELSSIFVAYFVTIILWQLCTLVRGPEAYAQFQDWLKSPFFIALNVISFFFVIFHTITWFNLTPKAMVVRIGGKRVPNLLVAGPNYVAWLAISAIVAWFILR